MNRREAFKNLGIMFGANLLIPLRRAISSNFDPNNLVNGSTFSQNQHNQVDAISDVIIPATDTPGAKAAMVAEFIDKMLSEWYEKDEKNAFIQELNGFLSFILKTHMDTFDNLDLDIQNQSIELINNGEITSLSQGGKSFFNEIKQLTIFGYYTSFIGMTVERRYLPNPGKYDGAYPYTNIKTLFTS